MSARDFCSYLVNKPLQAAGMFEGKSENLRTISQPRALSADIPASQKEVYLFYNPPINFHITRKTACKKPLLMRAIAKASRFNWLD